MKKSLRILAALGLTLAASMPTAFAQLNVPSDGSDGVLNITSNTVIDLSLATTANWDADNSANAGRGIYDSNKWAVVFKYSSVNIQSDGNLGPVTGYKVTFKNHPSYAPVVWLVQSNVTINGIVSLDGTNGLDTIPERFTPSEPGPGGFRGGASSPAGSGNGFGPAGGQNTYRSSYGNPQILPLIGGSGGNLEGYGHQSGGGAILIAAAGTVSVNGKITAKPPIWGNGAYYSSGGAIKIIANQIAGAGIIDAETQGRTRMEANTISSQINIFPNTVAVPPGTTPVIWPPSNVPTVRVVSVDGQPAPVDPSAALSTSSDIGMQNNSPVDIILETKNLPIQGVVALRIGPKYAAAYWLNATYVSGNLAQATWKVTTTLPSAFCVLQVRATAP